MSLQAFEFNDSVAVQSFDATNQRLAIASHSGTLKLFSVDAGGESSLMYCLIFGLDRKQLI